MNDAAASAETVDQQESAYAVFGAILNTPDPLLKAQADLIESAETTLSAWLRRRHEAVVEAQNLVARLRSTNDPAEFVSLQQEWVSGAMRRFTADATACQSVAQQLVDRSRSWFPTFAEGKYTNGNVAANGAEPPRAPSKPLRVAAKA